MCEAVQYFNSSKNTFELSLAGPDGNNYDISLPAYETQDRVPLSFGQTLCVDYFVDSDWIEYGFSCEGGDIDVSVDNNGMSIEEQILAAWENFSDDYEDFEDFMIAEVYETH